MTRATPRPGKGRKTVDRLDALITRMEAAADSISKNSVSSSYPYLGNAIWCVRRDLADLAAYDAAAREYFGEHYTPPHKTGAQS